ncbi:MAG: tRNA (adenosine(37)-N6)-threonylcarbamoyltransferase complex transferase subunit TsaD, partial [Chlamydiae bacterium]|nr:tRNA (adenosine(37)-N6)-threonylcarbamoyltransferase complex transferase subunit TsaD [Chlamydiota bacterium]
DLHRKYGGVFPELASRSHVEKLPEVLQAALSTAEVPLSAIELISVAKGPGLIGPLLVGLSYAKALSFGLNIPFVGVNHVEAHLYAAMMLQQEPPLPALGLVVSGGHTFLVLINKLGSYTMIGTTVDDAIGEAFDKIAKLLDLPYPGGPEIEALASIGDPSLYTFRAGQVKGKPYHFSFSGLKTNVFYSIYGQNGSPPSGTPCPLSQEEKASIASSFQETALQDIVTKTLRAARTHACRAIYVGGGVSHNKRLRTLLAEQGLDFPLFFPPPGLSLDNAAMIAGLGFHVYKSRKQGDPLTLRPETRIPLI